MFAIAAHLVNLHAQGLTGAFTEFGCFKSFSTAVLSDVCHQLGITMHVFDSFEGLPPSDSEYYRAGDFAGSLPELQANLATYGRSQPVVLHQGFFADTLPTVDLPLLVALWMDVDLESSARDVMPALAKLDPRGALFSHECPASLIADGSASAPRSPDQVVLLLLDGFAALERPVAARHIAGNTGAFWDATAASHLCRPTHCSRCATWPSPSSQRRRARWRHRRHRPDDAGSAVGGRPGAPSLRGAPRTTAQPTPTSPTVPSSRAAISSGSVPCT